MAREAERVQPNFSPSIPPGIHLTGKVAERGNLMHPLFGTGLQRSLRTINFPDVFT